MLGEALEQIKKRGNARVGDKTMIDAFEPALNELMKGVEEKLSFAKAFKRASDKAKDRRNSDGRTNPCQLTPDYCLNTRYCYPGCCYASDEAMCDTYR